MVIDRKSLKARASISLGDRKSSIKGPMSGPDRNSGVGARKSSSRRRP
jgi:hypothetical protein